MNLGKTEATNPAKILITVGMELVEASLLLAEPAPFSEIPMR